MWEFNHNLINFLKKHLKQKKTPPVFAGVLCPVINYSVRIFHAWFPPMFRYANPNIYIQDSRQYGLSILTTLCPKTFLGTFAYNHFYTQTFLELGANLQEQKTSQTFATIHPPTVNVFYQGFPPLPLSLLSLSIPPPPRLECEWALFVVSPHRLSLRPILTFISTRPRHSSWKLPNWSNTSLVLSPTWILSAEKWTTKMYYKFCQYRLFLHEIYAWMEKNPSNLTVSFLCVKQLRALSLSLSG